MDLLWTKRRRGAFFPKDFKKIEIPTGIAVFPAEMSAWPPKTYVERILTSNNGQRCKVVVTLLQWNNQSC